VDISKYWNGHTATQIKNRWNRHISKAEDGAQSHCTVARVECPSEFPAMETLVTEVRKLILNLCEAIGMKECDFVAIVTQLEGETLFLKPDWQSRP
jgi:hypothetical protein